MARVKAVFDADILIHLLKTKSIEFALETLGCIYISDYVYENEIKKDTKEGREIEKLKNSQKIKVLEYGKLTDLQKNVYWETYKLLENEAINKGERITASFSKAHSIYYYMSDDNKASSHIKSLAAVDIVNYCDILFLHLFIFGKSKIDELRKSYDHFINLYEKDKIPRILKNKGKLCTFEEMMQVTHSKFHKCENLMKLLDNIKKNVEVINNK
ncbi:hypothetical protein [Clostridium cellulovorans]|uniref:PIN domain-containing protein n=1 Tax=Clostridium cellulovorans (strain ATCC 35296 / DSM 3052 / OCM 3 / 743B) TaxID=573061 RepID=D9SSE1_CLOC7|nr:hypothetical protein [Clostridium cellulovorans]ADL50538.1 hypothetical protein Clocel_0768 [Clostridium cellulovorans 743B]